MEITKTKNYQLFDELHNSCVEKKDTFLGILTNEKADATAVQFCGDPRLLGKAFGQLFYEAYTDKSNEANIVIANAILNGINRVISEGDIAGIGMITTLYKVIVAGISENTGDGSFDPNDDDCKHCDDNIECLMRMALEYLFKNIKNEQEKPSRRKKNSKK